MSARAGRPIGRWLLLAGMAWWALSACTPSSLPAARDAGVRFQQALAGGDLPTACALLAEQSRSRLESQRDQRCADAIRSVALTTGSVQSVEVWGGNALARLDGGVLFLAEFGSGWKVVAAGCEPRAERPYDCMVGG